MRSIQLKSINRKLFRDLVYMRGQALAIGMVMACGVATFVMSLSMVDSLTGTLDTYYQQNRFAQVFAHMKRAPESLKARVSEIPGVSFAQTRIVEQVSLDMPDLAEPASGQILSLPDSPDEGLNLIYLRAGRFPEGNRSREVLVSQRFAAAHALNPGDTVSAVLNGRLEALSIVGIALSPEYIYLVPPGGMFPENLRYGIFWMARDEMEAAFDMDGAFNDLTLSLMPGASKEEVIDRIDALTARYGGLGAYEREDQISNQFVQNEITQLRGMTLIVPVVFLGVSAFLLNIVLSRMIASQREQIAALKALGYSNREIGFHYLGFVMLITLLAVVAGSLAGAWMGYGLTKLYIEFFDFPSFRYSLHPRVVMLGAAVSTLSAVIGVWHALRAAITLPPAEAMRPKAPPSFKPTVFERIGLHRRLSPAVRMIVRQLERSPFKTAFSVLGISMATAVLIVGSFSQDAVDYIIDFQFSRVQQFDVDVVLGDQADSSAVSTIRNLPGVLAIEPYRGYSVRLVNGHQSKRVGIAGLESGDGLYQLLDLSGNRVHLPEHGIVLSSALADTLGVRTGDQLRVESLEGRREIFDVPISGLIDDFSGLAAYMNLDALNTAMRERYTLGGAYLSIDESKTDELYTKLREMPSVVAVNVKEATVHNFRETIAESMNLMQPFLIGFASVIAFGVVYNSARISLSERSRDLATLRVLGFTKREVAVIQLGELSIITMLAVPVGLLLGYATAWYVSVATASELVRIPFIIEPGTFVTSACVVIIASLVSGLIVLRKLGDLDLVSVLKSRE